MCQISWSLVSIPVPYGVNVLISQLFWLDQFLLPDDSWFLLAPFLSTLGS